MRIMGFTIIGAGAAKELALVPITRSATTSRNVRFIYANSCERSRAAVIAVATI